MRAQILVMICLALSACKPADTAPRAKAIAVSPSNAVASNGELQIDEAALLGTHWRIRAIDGAAPVAATQPTLRFGQAHYSGNTGCNAIGGMFLAHTRRLFTSVGPQTEQGCGPLTQQEERITGLLASSPRIARLSSGKVALVDAKGALELERDQTNTSPFAEVPVQTIDGSAWRVEMLEVDGENVHKNFGEEAVNLIFTDKKWTSDIGCDGLQGEWVKREGRIDLYTSSPPFAAPPCPSSRQNWSDKMTIVMNAPSRIIINTNGEFLLASQDHWITGRTTPRRGVK